MPTLLQAFDSTAKGYLTKRWVGDGPIDGDQGGAQRGGTCGLYSLWYASVLLQAVNPTGRDQIIPRKYLGAGAGGMSSRTFSKSPAVGSGQGEILNWEEMQRIIHHFGYECDITSNPNAALREKFIQFSFEKNRPVLFAYVEGGNPPADCHPIAGYQPDYPGGCGPHWGLLIGSQKDAYVLLDPHWPNRPYVARKDIVISSNGDVDNWDGFDTHFTSMERMGTDKDSYKTKTYKIGDDPKSRQSLANLLISVY